MTVGSMDGAPQIAAQGTRFANVDITPLAYANPEKFPHGLEVAVFAPGTLAPIGKITLPMGFMVAVIGPEGARALVAAVRQAAAAMPPGQTRPPGM